jgi:hypothetical protein
MNFENSRCVTWRSCREYSRRRGGLSFAPLVVGKPGAAVPEWPLRCASGKRKQSTARRV